MRIISQWQIVKQATSDTKSLPCAKLNMSTTWVTMLIRLVGTRQQLIGFPCKSLLKEDGCFIEKSLTNI